MRPSRRRRTGSARSRSATSSIRRRRWMRSSGRRERWRRRHGSSFCVTSSARMVGVQVTGGAEPCSVGCQPECIEKRLRLPNRHVHHFRKRLRYYVRSLRSSGFICCQSKYGGTGQADCFALQYAAPDALIPSEDNPIALAAGAEPCFVSGTEGKRDPIPAVQCWRCEPCPARP